MDSRSRGESRIKKREEASGSICRGYYSDELDLSTRFRRHFVICAEEKTGQYASVNRLRVRAKRPSWIHYFYSTSEERQAFPLVSSSYLRTTRGTSDIYFYNVIKERSQLQTKLPRKLMIALAKEKRSRGLDVEVKERMEVRRRGIGRGRRILRVARRRCVT